MTTSSRTLGDLFDAFEREAFRLETLDDYSKSGSVDAYQAFLAGEPQPDDYNAGWVEELRSHTEKGKRVYRVHILSRPLTDYLRFELGWGYHKNVSGGEEFFILDITDKPNPLENVPDFWFFDSESVAVMNYDGSGKYLGSEVLPPERTAEFTRYRDAALAHAEPFHRMVGQVRDVNRAQLGAALRALRVASGKEAKAVARSALMSPSKLSKIENAKPAPSATDVERILTAIGVSDEVKAEYAEAARASATEATAWRLLKRIGVHKGQQAAKALEAQMSVLRLFQPALVPGLLQTPEYIRAILQRHNLSEDALTRTINGRLERQAVLYDDAKSLRFVITEPVLRWRIVRPQMMAAQLDRIVSISRLSHVDIRIVPLWVQQHDIANHAFVIRDDRMVTVETVHAEVVVTDPRDVSLYVDKFEGFERSALAGDEMRDLIEGIRNDFLREQETG